jgi:phosphatidate cytidylyltransferase
MAAPPGSKWADLGPRLISGIVLALVGFGAVWAGGALFEVLVLAVVGLAAWEVTRLCVPARPGFWASYGMVAAVSIFAALRIDAPWPMMIFTAAALVGASAIGRFGDRPRAALYLFWLNVAGWGIITLRQGGVAPVLWLVLVVVASDVAGYFAGRLIGGPKFWPAVSPKKTWAGTVAGWIAAALVGLAFAAHLGPGVIWLSVIMAFAGQMGDIAESALKRAKGKKDASALIPGHGGVFDRFDALMGAAFVLTLARLAGLGG